ncbi:hypothetical protein V8E36_000116 [Tilletia maclaganii]
MILLPRCSRLALSATVSVRCRPRCHTAQLEPVTPKFDHWPPHPKGSSTVYGVGTDILHVPRIAALLRFQKERVEKNEIHASESSAVDLSSSRFARRILTPAELAEFKQWTLQRRLARAPIDDLRWIGVRWAAKEAAYKALYPHIRLRWKDIELVKPPLSSDAVQAQASTSVIAPGPKPVLRLTQAFLRNESRQSDGLPVLHVSISHDGDYVLAFVVAELDEDTRPDSEP